MKRAAESQLTRENHEDDDSGSVSRNVQQDWMGIG
jgi:hypothetical protein